MSGIVVLVLRIVLAACLYGFLGWALVTIWRDLRDQGQMISAPNIPELILAPIETDTFAAQGFHVSEVIIGRSANTDYPIIDDTVSARHARLSYHQNQWWVEDLGSTNGTFLNDERVRVPTVMVSGDELRCGQARRIVEIGLDSQSTTHRALKGRGETVL